MTLNDKLYNGIYDGMYSRESECAGHQDATDACEKVCDEFAIAFADWINGVYAAHVRRRQAGDNDCALPFTGMSSTDLLHKFKTEVYGK